MVLTSTYPESSHMFVAMINNLPVIDIDRKSGSNGHDWHMAKC